MTNYDKALTIRHSLLTAAAESVSYGWDKEFIFDNLSRVRKRLLDKIGKVDPSKLTLAQMDYLGFGRWEKDSSDRMIPLWLFPFLADPPTDNDHRFGYLFDSVEPAKKEEHE